MQCAAAAAAADRCLVIEERWLMASRAALLLAATYKAHAAGIKGFSAEEHSAEGGPGAAGVCVHTRGQ